MTHKRKLNSMNLLAQFLQPTHQLCLSRYATFLPKKHCITFKPRSFPKFGQSQSKVSESIFEQTFFTCHPFIACILSCLVQCEVFYHKAVVFLFSCIFFSKWKRLEIATIWQPAFMLKIKFGIQLFYNSIDFFYKHVSFKIKHLVCL